MNKIKVAHHVFHIGSPTFRRDLQEVCEKLEAQGLMLSATIDVNERYSVFVFISASAYQQGEYYGEFRR